jgi:RNA polymerase sigma-70 factor (ECF subfamily)
MRAAVSDKPLPVALNEGRQQFLQLIADLRPELHRYCSRITGSVIDGEDVVQEVLAKVFYELSMSVDVPPLRPWLFRVAHNAAIDFCRRYEHRNVELMADPPEAKVGEEKDPEVLRAALSTFLFLPIRQRSAVILKDVLGLSLEETAQTMDTTVLAVKAALARGREQLRRHASEQKPAPDPAELRAELTRLRQYVSLFNARDWDGVRGCLAEEVRLDLVSQAARRGKQVGQYYGRYENERDLRLAVGLLEGRPAIAAFQPADSPRPMYFILLRWDGDKVSFIRDFKYAPYVAESAAFQAARD